MPTIGLEVGQMYTFIQTDRSNYYHPMGFAYGPDGNKGGYPELDPGTSASFGECSGNSTCPAPMYFQGDQYLGSYNNVQDITAVSDGVIDTGLDKYEPKFGWPIDVWSGLGPFYIRLKFDDYSHTDDLFYFCHVSATADALQSNFRNQSHGLTKLPRTLADTSIHVGENQTSEQGSGHQPLRHSAARLQLRCTWLLR